MRLRTTNSDIEAVIFDLDGTLVDSMWMWTDIDDEYLSRFGMKIEDAEQPEDISGMNMKETAEYFKSTYGIPRTIEQMIGDWIEMSLDKYEHEVFLKPYARELLDILKRSGVKTAIASSNGIPMIKACLRSNSVADQFDAVLSSGEVEHGKPFPDVYLAAAERIGTDPAKCLVFEDIPAGIMAAKAAGMTAVGVYDEFSSGSEARMREISDMYFHGFREFLEAEGLI